MVLSGGIDYSKLQMLRWARKDGRVIWGETICVFPFMMIAVI